MPLRPTGPAKVPPLTVGLLSGLAIVLIGANIFFHLGFACGPTAWGSVIVELILVIVFTAGTVVWLPAIAVASIATQSAGLRSKTLWIWVIAILAGTLIVSALAQPLMVPFPQPDRCRIDF